jgi:glucokinase
LPVAAYERRKSRGEDLMSTFPVLLGDIGGTNARFAVLPDPTSPAIHLPRLRTSAHANPVDAVRHALHGQNCPEPRSALLAVATRVDSPVVRLTNAPWIIDAAEIGAALRLSRVALVNDYVPVAASLGVLRGDGGELTRLGPELPIGPGAKLVLGPGTGLGAAALLPFGHCWALQPTEAAHVDFGPSSEIEMALWPGIERVGGRITAETLLSGPGLLRLYRAGARLHGTPAVCLTPEAVTKAGVAGTDNLAVDTLRLFARLLGRFAGDLVLLFGAAGGVFLGSGIAPTIIPFLDSSDFRDSFESKAPFGSLLQGTPTFVITHPDPALVGLAAIASHPERFSFEQQTWLG